MWTLKKLFGKSAKPLKADTPEWLNLWAFARYRLRLSDVEFWDLTFAQFSALVDQYNQEQETLNFRAGLICSVIAEINRDRKKRKKPFAPRDFMPRKEKKLTGEQIMQRAQIIVNTLGGETYGE